jgi:hypothetical protein
LWYDAISCLPAKYYNYALMYLHFMELMRSNGE